MASSTPASKANTTFGLDLFKELRDYKEDDKTANIFYSPFSISSALAMVLLGARGNTASQMSEVLRFLGPPSPSREMQMQMQMQHMQMQMQHMQMQMQHMQMQMQAQMQEPMQMSMQMQQQSQRGTLPPFLQTACLKTQDEVHGNFSKLMTELIKKDAPYSLSLANRLYGEQSHQFVEDFLTNTRKHYNAELEPVDFKTRAEAARVNINNWVEKQTQGKIKDLLAKGVLDSLTRLVLVNAIYFKGNWDKQFKTQATRDAPFKINKNESRMVKMMYQKAKFPLTYIPEVNCQILELPYTGKDLSMFIFLPNQIEDDTTGLEKLEGKLTYENFVEWTDPDKMDDVEVQVGLPRFKMEETYDLKGILIKMGMVDAFDEGMSDFSGMSPANDLVLSKVVHKAFVEVNEEGTEAAAATAAIMMLRCARITPPFIADHPFLFFICHKTSKSVLFAGRYCSPA